jgi:hypothetical protein
LSSPAGFVGAGNQSASGLDPIWIIELIRRCEAERAWLAELRALAATAPVGDS